MFEKTYKSTINIFRKFLTKKHINIKIILGDYYEF